MPRELSAGGVAVRRMRGRWWFAVIEPNGRPGVLALPKGLIDAGEGAGETAAREVLEETGLRCDVDRRLTDVRYVYTRGGQRIFKIVVFHLMRYRSGRIGDIDPAMRVEVASARWLPLSDHRRLSYRGEQGAAREAAELLGACAKRRAASGSVRRAVADAHGSRSPRPSAGGARRIYNICPAQVSARAAASPRAPARASRRRRCASPPPTSPARAGGTCSASP